MKNRIILFVVLSLVFYLTIATYLSMGNVLKDSANGIYYPSIMLDFEVKNIELINKTHGHVIASGFDSFPITNSNLPTVHSKYHTIEIFGYFDHDGVFHLVDYKIIKWHIFKYILSFIGFIWFVIIFFKEWKITGRGFKCRTG